MNTNDHPDYSANQPSSRQWAIIAIVAFVALCGMITFLAGGYFTFESLLTSRNTRAAETAVAATAVVQEQTNFLATAAQWPIEISDTFDNNANEWMDGLIDDEFARMNLSINGNYTWEIEAKQGFVWWVWPSSNPVSDFYLAVDAYGSSSSSNAVYGIIFHFDEDSQDYYYFEILASGMYSLWLHQNGQWEELIPYTSTSAIQPEAYNQLEVIAYRDEVTLIVNNQILEEYPIGAPYQGYAGVAVGLSYEDEQSTIIFDNFEVRAP